MFVALLSHVETVLKNLMNGIDPSCSIFHEEQIKIDLNRREMKELSKLTLFELVCSMFIQSVMVTVSATNFTSTNQYIASFLLHSL